MRHLAAAFLIAFSGLAPAADLPGEPRLAWTLGFGGATASPGPALHLALDAPRSAATAYETIPFAELQLAGAGAAVRIAGLPFWQQAFVLGQNPADAEGATLEAAPARKPWYARQWVLWTAGGLAATAALAGSSGAETEQCTGVCNQDDGGRTTGVTVDDGDVYAGCVEGECVVCPDGSVASTCPGVAPRLVAARMTIDADRDRWLDAGTGHMGDLIAR